MHRRSFLKGAAALAAAPLLPAHAAPAAIQVGNLSAIDANLGSVFASGTVWGEGSAALLGGASWLLKNARRADDNA